MRTACFTIALGALFSSVAVELCKADFETSFFTLELDPLLRPANQLSRCQECGGYHAQEITSALPLLNAQRKRGGLAPLERSEELELVAKKRLQQMVASGHKGHPPGSFAPGKYEGVGWASGHAPTRVSACYSMDPTVREAGAVMLHVKSEVYFVVIYR